jgi:hypothetical protein
MKDLYPLFVGTYKTGKNLGLAAGLKRAGVMFGHKIHPWIGQTMELAANQDYYGVELVHTGDKSYQQAWQVAEHYLKGFVPLTFKNAAERARSDASMLGRVGAGFGLVPAPKWLGNTPAMEMAFELAKRKMEAGPKTTEDFQKMQLMRQTSMRLITGKMTQQEVGQLVREGQLSIDDMKNLFDDQRLTPLQRHFKRLDPDEALMVWKRATSEEKRVMSKGVNPTNLQRMMLQKMKPVELLKKYSPEKAKAMMEDFRNAK